MLLLLLLVVAFLLWVPIDLVSGVADDWQGFLNQLPIGISIGAVLLLIALGLTFTFGQMGVINMAHGEFIMVGAYTAYMLQDWAGDQSVLVALPAAFAIAGLLGVVLERTLIRRFYGRPLDTLLLTWGVGLILQQLARDLIDTRGVQVPAPSWLVGGLRMGSVQIPYNRMFIFGVAVAFLIAIWFYLNRTPVGRRTRAVVQNRELAASMGVATSRVDQLTFFVGSGLAGAAGVTLTLVGPIHPTIGTNYIVDAFLVVVVGGLGQLRGAVLAALALGMINGFVEFSTTASLAKVYVLLAIVIFLQFRPQGLFQLRTRALT